MMVVQYTPEDGLIPIIHFGEKFKDRQLTSLDELDIVTYTPFGYDGQFYAQVALDPTLQNPEFGRALDKPKYRGGRIGLPLLAHVLGFGNTWWVLQVYAALNLVFWFGLFIILWKTVGFLHFRDILLAIAMLWSTGTLISVSRALTDLPAVVISYFAVVLQGTGLWWASLLGIATLFKETTILSFVTALPPLSKNGFFHKKSILIACLLFLPVTLWTLYVQFSFPIKEVFGTNNFSIPLVALTQKLITTIQNLVFSKNLNSLFELICLVSLLTQAIYLIFKPKKSDVFWQFGIGFAFLLFILGPSVLAEQFAYTRVLLPLTFAFNLLIHKYEKRGSYSCWFVIGNFGMGVLASQFLLISISS